MKCSSRALPGYSMPLSQLACLLFNNILSISSFDLHNRSKYDFQFLSLGFSPSSPTMVRGEGKKNRHLIVLFMKRNF